MTPRIWFSRIAIALCLGAMLMGQAKEPAFSAAEKTIEDQIKGLRALSDDVRAKKTNSLALEIRRLPYSTNKLSLAMDLASLSTEGDFGRSTLQEVTNTLAAAVREKPLPAGKGGVPTGAYIALAQLKRYEHMNLEFSDEQLKAATALLEAADASRQNADFTLTDLDGKKWNLKSLKGKVVLVNFWATWCPPCRKEMPDLQALCDRFKAQGFVILAISDEEASVVKPYLADHKISYPVMLDPGAVINKQFQVSGIPKSFVYDRNGRMVSQSIDMRTQRQFLAMLAEAGLK